jgi:hypothetical protein
VREFSLRLFRVNLPLSYRLGSARLIIDDSVELRGLINLDAEINYIDKATYEQLLGMIMISNLNIEMISHSNYRVLFIGICENVRFAVKLIKYEVCLFIIDVKTNYFFVLSAFFIF